MKYCLDKGWSVLEDVHSLGDHFKAYSRGFDPTRFGGDPSIQPMAPWEPIGRLEHLQLTFSQNPYYGRDLRSFNNSAWWYRNEFDVAEDAEYASLHFNGADYFADIWLNEVFLGSHEGYNTPFEFEVGSLIRKGEKNLLVVKVRAPWENNILPGFEYIRFCTVIRDQMKGTYEHSDTFVPRDINPIGLWDSVVLETYSGIRPSRRTQIDCELSPDHSEAQIHCSLMLRNLHSDLPVDIHLTVTRFDSTEPKASYEGKHILKNGDQSLALTVLVQNPELWTIWERGDANRYTAEITVMQEGRCLCRDTQHFGIRDIRCVRNESEMYYLLNGEKLYIRGTTYFPDVYISACDRNRYLRDINAAIRAGMNSLRIHVHSEKDEFYDLCDERGILLIQDSDFNWVHPADEMWCQRAVRMFEDTVIRLKNHPSIFCWVLLNEPRGDHYLSQRPGPQFMETVRRLDPRGTFILSSWDRIDPFSGDSHNYLGSLDGAHTHYTDIDGTTEKFNTEFGMDAPPCYYTLRKEPALCARLSKVIESGGIETIQYYQYRYIKYFIEHYRIMKYRPCGGHYQFLFMDCAPTSHFGVYDWQGVPKYSLRALEESNQPVAVVMETRKNRPVKVWAINDLLQEYPGASVRWEMTADDSSTAARGCRKIDLGKDSIMEAADLSDIPIDDRKIYRVVLSLCDADGRLLAKNVYEGAFNPPEHVKGHPTYVDHGIGLRMYWQWMQE